MSLTIFKTTTTWFSLNYFALCSKHREQLAKFLGCGELDIEKLTHYWNRDAADFVNKLHFLPAWFCNPGNTFDETGCLTYSPVFTVPEHKDYTSFFKDALNGWAGWAGYTKVVGVALCVEATQGGNTWFEDTEDESAAVVWEVRLKQRSKERPIEHWITVGRFNTQNQATNFQSFLQHVVTLDLPHPW